MLVKKAASLGVLLQTANRTFTPKTFTLKVLPLPWLPILYVVKLQRLVLKGFVGRTHKGSSSPQAGRVAQGRNEARK